ncbi:hypothetical protein Aros01_08552 [Streptosporangium roseum]|uniref:hypothetical protein n=1 Tax=Streptosporangium roseum TaxID=2001 RepID=UPI0030B6780C
MTEIIPTAVIRPAASPVSTASSAGGTLAPPAPMAATVGDIAGLSPRRARGDGGEVPGTDADAAFAHMDALRGAADLAELQIREAEFEAAVSAFIATAAERLVVPRRAAL